MGDLGGSGHGHGLGWSESGLAMGGHLTWDLFYLQGPNGCLVAFAILMCGLVVPTVLNRFCWLKCRVAYIASYHIIQGNIGNNLSHITHIPGLPIAKLLRPPSAIHGDAATCFC